MGIDDNPPLTTATLLGIQHVCRGGWLMMVVVIATTIGVRSLLDDVKQYSLVNLNSMMSTTLALRSKGLGNELQVQLKNELSELPRAQKDIAAFGQCP